MLAKRSLYNHIFSQNLDTNLTVSTLAPDSANDENVKQYTRLLIEEIQRNVLMKSQEEVEKYNDEAQSTTRVGNRKVCTFAPFRNEYSALKTITPKQGVVLSFVGLAVIAGLIFFRLNAIVAAIAMITVLYLSDLLLSFFLSVRTLNLSAEVDIDDSIVFALKDVEWPEYTILCPLYREAEIVPQFVQAMQALDYPKDKLQILFLTEEDDTATREAITDMKLPPHFSIITVPDGQPRTKPRACNYGLLQATGSYVVIYDAEDVPDPLQLKKAVLAFARLGEKIACIQAKLNFYNVEQNLLTRWFTAEYSLWFDLTLPGLQKLGVPLPLGGTSNHFRTHLLRVLGAWDAFNVTEDCDLGLRQAAYGFKTAVLNSTTYEEANSQCKNWIRQRSRWIKGYMQTYLVYMRKPQVYLRPDRLLEFLSLQLFVGGKTAVLLVNPFMWLLLGMYILLHSSTFGLYHILFPAPVLYMGVLCLIFGNFFYTYSHLIGCMKRGYFHLVKWTLLIPIYWAMASIAAFMALQQLILKPHYWEKTQHGLHLLSAGPLPKITVVAEVSNTAEELPQPLSSQRYISGPLSNDDAGTRTTVSTEVMSLDNEDTTLETTVVMKVIKRQCEKIIDALDEEKVQSVQASMIGKVEECE
jgi:cellulose synthase/poly-beta-1,6-N-acetylglucosamine synthase-like glycosyltransferase